MRPPARNLLLLHRPMPGAGGRTRAVRALLAALLVSVGPGLTAAPTEHRISIRNLAYNPNSLNVRVGDTVTWTNEDDHDHTIRSSDSPPTLDSGNLSPGKTYSVKMRAAATLTYGCSYHPRMKGTLNVKP